MYPLKKLTYLSLSAGLFWTFCMFSTELGLGESSISYSRPEHLPQNLPLHWGSYEQAAYLDGRLSYNADSTLCIISSDRLLSHEHVEEFKKKYGVLSFKINE